MTEYNYVLNPRAHLTPMDGWEGGYPPFTRVTTVPWGALPEGADAAFTIPSWNSSPSGLIVDLLGGELSLSWTITHGATGGDTVECLVGLDCFDDAEWLGFVNLYDTAEHENRMDLPTDAWHVASGASALPYGTTRVSGFVGVYAQTGGATIDQGFGYFTKFRLGGTEYADGDSAGWEWTGAEHASVSRTASFIPPSAGGLWTAPGKVLFAWGAATPTYNGLQRKYDHYEVSRSTDGENFNLLGTTRADCWFDQDVKMGAVYMYKVVGIRYETYTPPGSYDSPQGGLAIGEGDEVVVREEVGPMVTATVPGLAKIVPPPPHTPANYTVSPVSGGRLHRWDGQLDNQGRRMLAYFIEDGNQSQPFAVIWENPDYHETGWQTEDIIPEPPES